MRQADELFSWQTVRTLCDHRMTLQELIDLERESTTIRLSLSRFASLSFLRRVLPFSSIASCLGKFTLGLPPFVVYNLAPETIAVAESCLSRCCRNPTLFVFSQ